MISLFSKCNQYQDINNSTLYNRRSFLWNFMKKYISSPYFTNDWPFLNHQNGKCSTIGLLLITHRNWERYCCFFKINKFWKIFRIIAQVFCNSTFWCKWWHKSFETPWRKFSAVAENYIDDSIRNRTSLKIFKVYTSK